MHRHSILRVLAPLVPCLVVAAQEPQPPVFRTGIDLLTLDVAVLEPGGAPVRDLQPGDFSVTISGKPRRVVSARVYGASASRGATEPATTIGALPAAHLNSTAGGRLVMFVVDRESIQSGSESALLQAAGAVVDALEPSDAAGLVGLPLGGVPPTREHERVRARLGEMIGMMPREDWPHYITWEEAVGFERGDKQLIAQAFYRECRPARADIPFNCDKDVIAQAMQMLLVGRSKARTTLGNLTKIVDDLAQFRCPKHLIVISGGLLFEPSLLTDYNMFVGRAEAAGIALHIIHVDQAPFDSATRRRVTTSSYGGRELSQGLMTIAGMTDSRFYFGTGTAAGVFERISTEITNLYQLAVETDATDTDGKSIDVKVAVNRPGVTVRAPSHVPAPGLPTTGTPAERVTRLLSQPTDLPALPLRVTSYTTRGDDPDRLRVVIAAEITAGRAASAVDWAFTVLNEGNAVATGGRRAEATATDEWLVTASTKLVPGRYRLRFAAIASDGRAGLIDAPLAIGLRAADTLQLSDLVVGTAEGGRLVPRSRIAEGSEVRMMIESMAADAERLAKGRIALEVVPAGSSEPVKRILMGVRPSPSSSVLLNEAYIEAGTLPAGRYLASAIATIGNQPVGRVTRLFEVVSRDQ